jgi:hypothetical protein
MSAEIVDLEPSDADLRAAYRRLRETYRDLATSVKMIRHAVERSFPALAGLAASEQFETPNDECFAIAQAISNGAAQLRTIKRGKRSLPTNGFHRGKYLPELS